MKVAFHELPPPLRIGGLEKACRELQAALEAKGVEVVADAPAALPDADLAHFHGLWSPAHACLARRYRALGIPYVTSPHGMLEPWAWKTKRWKKLPYFRLIERQRLARGAAVLATAPQEGERLARFVPGEKVHILPLGTLLEQGPDYASARQELGWPENERVLLYLSRIHPKKGLLELLQALAKLDAARLAKVRLVIVGEGEEGYVSACRALSDQLSGKLRIDWLEAAWGPLKWRYLQGADLLCLPTYSENFGLVVLEAVQVGTPVLTTVETPWQALAGAGLGWVTPPTVSAYTASLEASLAGPLPDDAARARALAWAEAHFAWKNVVTGYLDLYRQLCSHRHVEATAS